MAGARRAVPSRVDPDRRGTPHSPQLPGVCIVTEPTPPGTRAREAIETLLRREDLVAGQAEAVMEEVMSSGATPTQIAGFLIALAMKGVRPPELVGLARTMRHHAVRLPAVREACFDTCGTGGDRSNTFNVSSVTAIVLAACGIEVAKHGNRSVSSRCGSADLFEALGVRVDAGPDIVTRCLDKAGIGFFFAPAFHPSMRHAGPVRRELGVPTAFNLLGPLTNPAGARRQVIGVPRPELTDLLAQALLELGTERAWVVHGTAGLDEVSTVGPTKVCEVRDGEVAAFFLSPGDFGLPETNLSDLRVEGLDESVAVARSVLGGEKGPARDFVLANAGSGLLVAGQVDSLRDGVALAARAIDEERAQATLATMARVSQEGSA
ncbi:MAG: anthranilate phosphoribosyltransferase [Acidobacteria bacterium]|nr:anthranilate phosphoribosyltransferase [Acidobacteriota bacterium]MYJ03710.1 anthranilate phosphoribosyltransferase [Acidobacteriota bacterium]